MMPLCSCAIASTRRRTVRIIATPVVLHCRASSLLARTTTNNRRAFRCLSHTAGQGRSLTNDGTGTGTAAAARRMVDASKMKVTTTRRHFASDTTTTSSSGGGGGIMDKLRDKWDNRNARAQEEKLARQMEKMASAKQWTLQDVHDDLQDTLGNWRNKIPGVSNMEQVKAAKETQELIQAVMEQVGPEATCQTLENLGRHEKLKISLKSGSSLEDLNLLVRQFQGMDIMQQTLRRRKLAGRPLPTDEESMKVALQQDASKVMTKTQKKQVMKARQRKRF